MVNLLFSRPSEERTISLSLIAEKTKLSMDEVEHLLIKSLSVSTSLNKHVVDFECPSSIIAIDHEHVS